MSYQVTGIGVGVSIAQCLGGSGRKYAAKIIPCNRSHARDLLGSVSERPLCERERERDKDRETERETQRDRKRERDTHRETARE